MLRGMSKLRQSQSGLPVSMTGADEIVETLFDQVR